MKLIGGLATQPKLSVIQVVEMTMIVSSKDSVVEALPFDPPLEIRVSNQEESGHIRPHICTGLMLIVALIVAMWDSKVHVRSHTYDSTQCQIRIHELGLACIQKPTNLKYVLLCLTGFLLALNTDQMCIMKLLDLDW